MFMDSGVYFCDNVNVLSNLLGCMSKGALMLHDLNESQYKAMRPNEGISMFAAPPVDDRYMGWQKQLSGQSETFIMNVWDWTELYLAR